VGKAERGVGKEKKTVGEKKLDPPEKPKIMRRAGRGPHVGAKSSEGTRQSRLKGTKRKRRRKRRRELEKAAGRRTRSGSESKTLICRKGIENWGKTSLFWLEEPFF